MKSRTRACQLTVDTGEGEVKERRTSFARSSSGLRFSGVSSSRSSSPSCTPRPFSLPLPLTVDDAAALVEGMGGESPCGQSDGACAPGGADLGGMEPDMIELTVVGVEANMEEEAGEGRGGGGGRP